MTSVKDFRVVESATPDRLGRGAFLFTDAYSVFDWGKMPDAIPDKGAALCTMGAFNFERLEAAGVPTHYRGVVVEDVVRPLQNALADGAAPDEMAIDLANVPALPVEDGEYDYDAFHDAAGSNYLIPLEIVFRNRVGVGSSLRDRASPADVGLSMAEWPDHDVDLPSPVVEFSTKFEEQDRYLDRSAAARIAGRADLATLESVATEVNRIVTDQAERAGLTHQDGKIECLYVDGEVRVADVVGTFDENRFAVDGQPVSKEVLRQYHKRTQPEWVEAVAEAKAAARAAGDPDWKARCAIEPEPLRDSVIEAARGLYCAGTNAYVDREVFDAPSLSAAIDAVRAL